MNKERMLELANVIENAKSDQFHLGSWFGHYDGDMDWFPLSFHRGPFEEFFIQQPNELSCGTTACIAGWATAMKYGFNKHAETEDSVEQTAMDYLGLTIEQADRLFYGNKSSVWALHQHEYEYKVTDTYFDEYYGEEVTFEMDPEHWTVSNKDAADMLKRIVSGEVYL